MIFKPEMVHKILAGEKTVTRQPVKLEDGGYGGAIFRPCRYEVGKDYAVQPGRGQKAVARIRIVSVKRQRLGSYTVWPKAEARLEGFPRWQVFRNYWHALYGSYNATQLVDRIEFELLPSPQEGQER